MGSFAPPPLCLEKVTFSVYVDGSVKVCMHEHSRTHLLHAVG